MAATGNTPSRLQQAAFADAELLVETGGVERDRAAGAVPVETAAGRLRHGLGMDKAGHFDVAQTGGDQAVYQVCFVGRLHQRRLILQPIARPNLINLQQLCHHL